MFKIFCIALGVFSAVFAEPITVCVASKSPKKIKACLKAFEQAFGHEKIIIKAFEAASGVPNQPIGRQVGCLGAFNRLDSLVEPADYYVAFENFIEEENGRFFDRAAVVLKNLNTSESFLGFSEAVEVSKHLVEEAKMASDVVTLEGFSSTVGEIIHSQSGGVVDANDWHKEPQFGGISRVNLLNEALFQTLHQKEIMLLKSKLQYAENFPKEGVLFANFFPILSDKETFHLLIELLAKRYQNEKIDFIVGLESRGFILAAALANRLSLGFVPIRKPGKLPGKVYSLSYQKEYGFDTLTLAEDAIFKGAKVVIIDDLIATGGSANAAIKLIQKAGGDPIEFVSVLEVESLKGRFNLNIPSFNLIR
jgi:adenine phosphoribosyltransferase